LLTDAAVCGILDQAERRTACCGVATLSVER
jgi:hypothetical protein